MVDMPEIATVILTSNIERNPFSTAYLAHDHNKKKTDSRDIDM